MITLFDKPECPFCYRVRVALGFAGLEFERRDYDDPAAEREWRSLTPAKTVPVMVEDDLVLTDSAVMLEYLQDRTGMLLPEAPTERARARTLLQYADKPLGRGSREVVFAKRGRPESEWDAERIAAAGEETVRVSHRFFEIELTNAGARPDDRLILTKPIGTGVMINIVPPEQAADALRSVAAHA